MLDNRYTRHHKRFLVAAIVAFAAWWPLGRLALELRLTMTGDIFFLIYLVLILHLTMVTSQDRLRERAQTEDEGIILISILTVVAVGLSLFSILILLNKGDGPELDELLLALASVPLGWLTLHAVAAQHYANLYYSQQEAEDGGGDRKGLEFPGDTEPGIWDFLYFSFVIGMTAQTSDVQISAPAMRRPVLAHSITSFFFNTVLVAVAVNAAVGGAH
jgi:uncharacterized membrane protein